LSASGRIIGSDIELNFSLNETSTIYLVGLNGESTEPTVEEIKQAGEGTTSIENQVFSERLITKTHRPLPWKTILALS